MSSIDLAFASPAAISSSSASRFSSRAGFSPGDFSLAHSSSARSPSFSRRWFFFRAARSTLRLIESSSVISGIFSMSSFGSWFAVGRRVPALGDCHGAFQRVQVGTQLGERRVAIPGRCLVFGRCLLGKRRNRRIGPRLCFLVEPRCDFRFRFRCLFALRRFLGPRGPRLRFEFCCWFWLQGGRAFRFRLVHCRGFRFRRRCFLLGLLRPLGLSSLRDSWSGAELRRQCLDVWQRVLLATLCRRFRRRRRIIENGERGLSVLDQFRDVVVVLRSPFDGRFPGRRFGGRFRLGQGHGHQLGGLIVGMLRFGLFAGYLRQSREGSGQAEFLVGNAAHEFEIDGSGLRLGGCAGCRRSVRGAVRLHR